MKKTAIVSCYFIHNYGSVLQAYATQQVLEKLNFENETIEVSGFIKKIRKKQYIYIIRSGIRSSIFRDRLGKAKNLIYKKIIRNNYTKNIRIRDIEFEKFIYNYINKSPKYKSLKELSEKCYDNYSTVVLGSDQLWLPANIAADYYTLNFVPKSVNSVAYATSFGVSQIPDDVKKMAKKFLPRIKHISVREETGKKLVKEITGQKVPVVCDPTLLFTGDEWMKIQEAKSMIKYKYIFCYFIGDAKKHREFAKKLRDKTGCKIVALTHIDCYMRNDEDYADYTPFDVGPDKFLNLIRNAEYICTDSFHCTVFSILYQKKFFEFRRYINTDSKQSTNSRITTLFDLVGIDKDKNFLSGDEDIDKCLEIQYDYDAIHNRLEIIRKSSYEYLIDAIDNKGSTSL